MKHLIKLESHDAYDAYSTSASPVVIYDSEHIHWSAAASKEQPEEETKYKLAVEVTDVDFGEVGTYEFSYAENAAVNESIEHMGTIGFDSTVYNADTNEELGESSPITVDSATNGFAIGGTMPAYNVKVCITVSSLA